MVNKDTKEGFSITDGRGFQITFENGVTVSVQFGSWNYCENHGGIGQDDHALGSKGSETAETAIYWQDGEFLKYKGGDVQGWQTAAEVAETIAFAQSLSLEAITLMRIEAVAE